MPQVYFYKLDEMPAQVNGVDMMIWHIRLEDDGVEYYIRSDKVHSTLQRGRYWSDRKHLLEIRATQRSEFGNLQQQGTQMKPKGEPNVYQQVQCGKCDQVNLVQIDPIIQGSHFCTRCKGTVAIVAGKHLQLKNGSKAGRTTTR